jgi:hypothetical protein
MNYHNNGVIPLLATTRFSTEKHLKELAQYIQAYEALKASPDSENIKNLLNIKLANVYDHLKFHLENYNGQRFL